MINEVHCLLFSYVNQRHDEPPPRETGLSEMLRECPAPIVGLDKVREIKMADKNDRWRFLLYICTICRVREKYN